MQMKMEVITWEAPGALQSLSFNTNQTLKTQVKIKGGFVSCSPLTVQKQRECM